MCLADLESVRNMIGKLIEIETEIAELVKEPDPEAPKNDSTPLRRITDEEYEEVLRARKRSIEVQLEELGYKHGGAA